MSKTNKIATSPLSVAEQKYAVGVCNGTVALHLALTCLGIAKDDEVIVSDFTMIASAFSVCYTGPKPVFVDVDIPTYNIKMDQIEEAISPKKNGREI